MANETIQLILDMGNSSAVVQKLTEDLDANKKKMEDVARQFAAGEINAKDFIKAQGQLGHELGQSRELLDQLTGKPGQRGSAGQGLMGASYAVQDFVSVLTGGGGLAHALAPSVTTSRPF